MKLFIDINEESKPEIIYWFERVSLFVTDFADINLLLNDKQKIEDAIEETKSLYDDEIMSLDECNSEVMKLEKLKEMEINVNSFDDISINFSRYCNISEYKDFLETINSQVTIDINNWSCEKIKLLSSINFKKMPLVETDYNKYDNVYLSDYLESVKGIYRITDLIEKHRLSPLEKLMFLYDLLKERVYSKSYDDNLAISRDLSRVTNPDEKIVCAGFANFFTVCANELGIRSYVKFYNPENDKNPGHATSVSYVIDSKYNYCGVLEFDLTRDCKRNMEEIVTNNLYGFGISECLIEKNLHNRKRLSPANSIIGELKTTFERFIKLKQYVSSSIYEKNLDMFLKKIIEVYQNLSLSNEVRSLDALIKSERKYAIPDDVYSDLIDSVASYFNKNLENVAFKNVLSVTRLAESDYNFAKYFVDNNDINQIANLWSRNLIGLQNANLSNEEIYLRLSKKM